MIDTQFWNGSFDTRRWMADTSLEGQWKLDEATTITPKVRAVYFSETVPNYSVKNSSGDDLAINGFKEDQLRMSVGVEIARSYLLEGGTKLTPKIGATAGYAGLDGGGAFGSIATGVSLQTSDLWNLDTGLLFDIEGEGNKSVGAKISIGKKF